MEYREKVFLPAWDSIKDQLRVWDEDGNEVLDLANLPRNRRVVVWYHDESTFYSNDR